MTQSALTPTRSIFYGFGAWVGRLDGRTTCSFWADDPSNLGFDHDLWIQVDLSRNPTAYINGSITIDQIEVDDAPADGGLTKIGPTWPTGSTINGVWLESNFYRKLTNPPAFPQPFMDSHDYELTTLVDWSPGEKVIQRRFWGCYAEITAEQGSLALCTIWTPGTGVRKQRPAGTWWIDLATQADPPANGYTKIDIGPGRKQGALFLDANAFRSVKLAGPKIPPWEGGLAIPLSTMKR